MYFRKLSRLTAVFCFALLQLAIFSAYEEPDIHIDLNGTSGVIMKDPDVFRGGSTASWNIWVKQDNYTEKAVIIGKYEPKNDGRSFLIRTIYNKSLSFVISKDGETVEYETSAKEKQCGVRKNGEWTMITITYDRGRVKYYRNGILCDTDTTSSTVIFKSNSSLTVGQGNKIFFNGKVDDVKIYKTALNRKQVARLYDDSIHGKKFGQSIPSLVYHDIRQNPSSTYQISPEVFEQQMKFLKDNKFRTITMEEFDKWQADEIELPEKSVMIVFDDGKAGVYKKAYPIMEEYGLVGNVAVVTTYSDRSSLSSGYIPWQEMRELRDSGWGFLSHGLTHSSMTGLSESEFRRQLSRSKTTTESKMGVTPDSFVFPFHASSASYTEICAEYYERCWTVGGETSNPGYNYEWSDGHDYGRSGKYSGMKRITIRKETTLTQFKDIFGKSSGITGEWRMDEGRGTVTRDTSGNGGNGTLTAGATWKK